MSKAYDLTIKCDGGCIPNPGKMYGSYQLYRGDHPFKMESRFDLGEGTNNRAEILALKRGAQDLIRELTEFGASSTDFNCLVITDSKLLVGWVNMKMGFQDGELQRVFLGCYSELKKFKTFKAVWTARENIELLFGH